jgi:hypothetical protein
MVVKYDSTGVVQWKHVNIGYKARAGKITAMNFLS